jgi:UDP-N-acetylmuramate dehydrogenase
MIQYTVSLQPFNTFGLDATAKAFARFESEAELLSYLEGNHLPLFILGGGSNVLFTKNVDCLVLQNGISGIELIEQDDLHAIVRVGAGEQWHDFVMHCINENWCGLENLSLIPGSVGASPMQNIGAYGVEIKDFFHSLTAIEIETGKKRLFTNSECEFGYRESVFKHKLKNKFIITSVTFKLSKTPQFKTSYGAIQEELNPNETLSIRAISEAVIRIRQSKLPNPADLGNAGSFFKNPVVSINLLRTIQEKFPHIPNYPQNDYESKLPAGWLIEQAGWKGKRVGNVGMHEKQALVLVNYGGANGQELLEHSERVINSVKEKFDVLLEREVNIW